jgi:uroporphyrinogen decarboxylase
MLPRERVIDVIEHRKPDRVPIYGWVRANLQDQIAERFGSVEAFEDKYEFDFAHLFGGPKTYDGEELKALRKQLGGPIEPHDLLKISPSDPNDERAYEGLKKSIDHHKTRRGRFVYMQTPGILECLNGPFGIENHLMYLAMYENELKQVYARQAEWNRAFAMNGLDLGIDMVHVSDDWGAQKGLMISPAMWRRMIFPYHKVTADAVKARGAYLSLHSDGDVSSVLDGIAELGYDVVHPFQESAGMDFQIYRQSYADKFVLMGGLDVQTTIGFGDYDRLRSDIERVVGMFRDGGLLFCTSHFVQNHCSMDELEFAYDLIHELIRN